MPHDCSCNNNPLLASDGSPLKTRGTFEGTHDITLIPAPVSGVRTITMLRMKNRSDDEITPDLFIYDENARGFDFEELPLFPDFSLDAGEMMQAVGAVEVLYPGQSLRGRLSGDPGSPDDQPSYIVAWTDSVPPANTGYDFAVFTASGQRKVQSVDAAAHRTLYSNASDSTQILNTTSETEFDLAYSVPAGLLAEVGTRLRIGFKGQVQSNSTAVTAQFRLKFGSTTIFDCGALGTLAATRPFGGIFELVTTGADEMRVGCLSWLPFRSNIEALPQDTGSLDFSVANDLNPSVQFSSAHPGINATLQLLTVDNLT